MPDIKQVKAVFAEIDRLGGPKFLPEGRPEQPSVPPAPPLDDGPKSAQVALGMRGAELRLAFKPDHDGTGEIFATVRSGAFSGRASAWFDQSEVQKTFIPALKAFPLSAANPPMIEGGFWSGTNPASLEQCHLRVVITPYDGRGTLLVEASLSTQSHATPARDMQQSLTARFLTEYAAVDRFAAEFDQVMNGNRDEAVLSGTESLG